MMTQFDDWYKISRDSRLGINMFVEYIIRMIYSIKVKKGEVVIDGGANRGLHTLPMAQIVGESGQVLAFEAVPMLAEALKARVDPKNTVVINKALAASRGLTRFTYVKGAHTRSGIREQAGLSAELKASVEILELDACTIDEEVLIWRNAHPIRFIKLDLEGGEYHALLGAKNTILIHQPIIIFENGGDKSARIYGYAKEDVFAYFSESGYLLFDIFGRSYTIDKWGSPGIPPYLIAVAQAEDIDFIDSSLQHVISTLAMPYFALTRES